MANNELKQVSEWVSQLNVVIMDPDGFRDLGQLWKDVYMTKDQFNKRLMVCTISRKGGMGE